MKYKERFPQFLYCLVLFLFVIIVCRLIYLSCGLSDPVLENRTYVRSVLSGQRGEIYDSYGDPFVMNTARYFCKIVPHEIRLLSNLTLDQIEDDVGLKKGVLSIKKQSSKKAIYVKKNMTIEEKKKIQKKGYKGVYFDERRSRFYPHRELACHILGLCPSMNHPISGLELSFDKWLKGRSGEAFSAVDVYRQPIYHYGNRKISSVKGYDLFLSLEASIQYMVEFEARKTFDQSHPVGLHVIVVNYQTGEIYASLSLPHFDPNFIEGEDLSYLDNPVISHVFEPGSTFKIVTLTACIEEGLVHEKTPINCENGVYAVPGRRPLKDHHAYGTLSVEDVIKKSSNIGTVKLAQKLGKKRLYYWIRSFGFAQKTGVELPFESVGQLRDFRMWHKSTMASIPMGQEIAVPPLQMVMAFCAIANEGLLVQPTVWRLIQHEDGRKKRNRVTEVRRVCHPETARRVKRMLFRVTETGGTGVKAQVEGQKIAGKTGTAQKYDANTGTYSQTDYFSSFIGFVDNPKVPICVGVFVDSPIHSMRYGGTVCAPLFQRIVSRILQYRKLNIEKKV